MPHNDRAYGEHRYVDGRTSDCAFSCGCWMGDSRSGGPVGIDPFGKCPNNPLNGKCLPERQDYDIVVTQRIEELTRRMYLAEKRLESVRPSKIFLAKELAAVKSQLSRAKDKLATISGLASENID